MYNLIFFMFYSVVDTEWSYNSYQESYNIPWKCEKCDMSVCLSPLEKLQHKYFTCSSRTIEKKEEKKEVPIMKPNSKEYKCDSCNNTLYLTPVEILKHKKACKIKE